MNEFRGGTLGRLRAGTIGDRRGGGNEASARMGWHLGYRGAGRLRTREAKQGGASRIKDSANKDGKSTEGHSDLENLRRVLGTELPRKGEHPSRMRPA